METNPTSILQPITLNLSIKSYVLNFIWGSVKDQRYEVDIPCSIVNSMKCQQWYKNTPNNLFKVTLSYFRIKTVALTKPFDMLRIAL